MIIRSNSFHLPALKALERVLEVRPDLRFGDIHRLGLHVSETPELLPAGFAFSNGVIGIVVRAFENGSAAFEAFKLNSDLVA